MAKHISFSEAPEGLDMELIEQKLVTDDMAGAVSDEDKKLLVPNLSGLPHPLLSSINSWPILHLRLIVLHFQVPPERIPHCILNV